MTRKELEEEVRSKCNDIISEITCRKGQPFEGELDDALRYVDHMVAALESLNSDDYIS